MTRYGLWVMLEAKSGKEDEVEDFLKSALPLVHSEEATVRWYALDLGGGKFAIYDTFETEEARESHLSGQVATALKAKADELFARPPIINKVGIVAEK